MFVLYDLPGASQFCFVRCQGRRIGFTGKDRFSNKSTFAHVLGTRCWTFPQTFLHMLHDLGLGSGRELLPGS